MPDLRSGWQYTPTLNSDATDQALSSLRLFLDQLIPLGSLLAFSGLAEKVPSRWLICDGAEYPQAQYSDLFDIVSTTWNTGGETAGYFRVPDLRGRVPVALDNQGGSDAGRLSVANTLGLTGGTETHTLTTAQMPSHSHYIYNLAWVSNSSANLLVPNSAAALGTPTSSTGSGGAHPNMQPYALVHWIVRGL